MSRCCKQFLHLMHFYCSATFGETTIKNKVLITCMYVMLGVTYEVTIVVKKCDFPTRLQFSFVLPIFSTISINQLANDLL